MKDMPSISEIIIPAIDIIGGECVRLTQGDYEQKKSYGLDILEVAREYEAAGLRRLHCVDLDGAKAGRPMNLAVLERLAGGTGLQIEWGGGMGSEEALQQAFECGAAKVICGSVAVKSPQKFSSWLRKFGPERVILGADVRGEKVAVHGWLEDSEVTIWDLIDRFLPDGLSEVICTDISRDGMLQGPAFGLYAELTRRYPDLRIIASGGISSIDDILRLAHGYCDNMVSGIIVGKALYEGRVSISDLQRISLMAAQSEQ